MDAERYPSAAKRVRAAARIAAFVSDAFRGLVTPVMLCQHALTSPGRRIYAHVNRR
jgi:hypothetical protein